MFGLIFGSLTEQIQDVEGNARDWWTEAGGTDRIIDAYQVSIIQMAGMFVAIYVVQVLLRMRVDETGGTLEPVLASGVTRTALVVGTRRERCRRVRGARWCCSPSAWAWPPGRCSATPPTQVRELVWAGLVQLPGRSSSSARP